MNETYPYADFESFAADAEQQNTPETQTFPEYLAAIEKQARSYKNLTFEPGLHDSVDEVSRKYATQNWNERRFWSNTVQQRIRPAKYFVVDSMSPELRTRSEEQQYKEFVWGLLPGEPAQLGMDGAIEAVFADFRPAQINEGNGLREFSMLVSNSQYADQEKYALITGAEIFGGLLATAGIELTAERMSSNSSDASKTIDGPSKISRRNFLKGGAATVAAHGAAKFGRVLGLGGISFAKDAETKEALMEFLDKTDFLGLHNSVVNGRTAMSIQKLTETMAFNQESTDESANIVFGTMHAEYAKNYLDSPELREAAIIDYIKAVEVLADSMPVENTEELKSKYISGLLYMQHYHIEQPDFGPQGRTPDKQVLYDAIQKKDTFISPMMFRIIDTNFPQYADLIEDFK